MQHFRIATAAIVVCGLGVALGHGQSAQGADATNLMDGVPSTAAIVDALRPADATMKTRGIRVKDRTDAPPVDPEAKPAADLAVTFEFDSAELTPAARSVLDNLGTALDQDLAAYRFTLEGHTDAVGSGDYNQYLSERRAQAVRDYLVTRHAVDPARLAPVGKGEESLLLPQQPSAGENRRVRVINEG